MVMADFKHWKPTSRAGAFRYYITATALRHFQEVRNPETAGLPDQATALVLDEMVAIAMKAKPPQDISLAINGENAKICEVQVRYDLTMVGVLQTHRPSAFPPTPMIGGPTGMQLALIALISQERAAQNFTTGKWKIVLNRPFAEPLAKLRLLSDPETLINPATGNQVPEEEGNEEENEEETQPVTQEEPMDAESQKSYSTENVVTARPPKARQPRKSARPAMNAAMEKERQKLKHYAELNEKVIAALQDGMSLRDVVEKFAVSKSTAHAWAVAARLDLSKKGRRLAAKKTAATAADVAPWKASGNATAVAHAASDARNERAAYAVALVKALPDIRVTGSNGLHEALTKKFGASLAEGSLREISRRVRAEKGLPPNPRGGIRSTAAVVPGIGLGPRIRELMADGKERSIAEVVAALGSDPRKTGIELSNLTHRKSDKSMKALGNGVYHGVYQYQAKGKRNVKTTIQAPVAVSAASSREDRVAYAAEQFRLNPNLPISGRDGIRSMLEDRFGVGMDAGALSRLRDNVLQGQHLPQGVRTPTQASPTIGKSVLRAMPMPSTEDGLMQALTLAIAREKQLKDDYAAARATTKMLLEQMQKIRE